MTLRHSVGLDAARFLAACAVVWIHAAESASGIAFIPACRFAVPFFTASIVFLCLTGSQVTSPDTSWLHYTTKRLQRLYVPFLLWSIIYLLLRCAKHRFIPDASPIILGPATLVNGTAHHLWFLPFALVMSLLAFPLGVWLDRASEPLRLMVSIAAFVLGIVISLSPYPLPMDPVGHPVSYFVNLGWDALPAALLAGGAAIALPHIASARVASVATIAFVVTVIVLLVRGHHPLTAAVAGISLLAMALHVRIPESLHRSLTQLGSLSLGIYLIHVLFVEGFQALRQIMHISPSPVTDCLIVLLAIGLSVAGTWLVRRAPLGRFLVPGS